jgi:hypothetical protein
MPHDQLELYHHCLLKTLYTEGLTSNFAFHEYCRTNKLDPSADCPGVWSARKAIWELWGC